MLAFIGTINLRILATCLIKGPLEHSNQPLVGFVLSCFYDIIISFVAILNFSSVGINLSSCTSMVHDVIHYTYLFNHECTYLTENKRGKLTLSLSLSIGRVVDGSGTGTG